VGRGGDGDVDDFGWLLGRLAGAGEVLPELNAQELEDVSETGESLRELDCLVLIEVMGSNNAAALTVPCI